VGCVSKYTVLLWMLSILSVICDVRGCDLDLSFIVEELLYNVGVFNCLHSFSFPFECIEGL